MSAAALKQGVAGISPRWKGRIAGIVYLASGMTYPDMTINKMILVNGNAAATAHNVLINDTVLRRCFGEGLFSAASWVVLTLLLYELLKPVSKSLSRLAAMFSLVGCAIGALACLFIYAPLLVLEGAPYLSVFKLEQLQALSLLSLDLHNLAAGIAMAIFAYYNLTIGYLILRSTFLPRILGVFLMITGLAYQLYLSPPLATRLFYSVIMPAGALGEMSLILWLIVFGVNPQRWKEQAGAA